MKERPILFSGTMVRAILDGRKTQTRRVVKLGHVKHPITSIAYDREELDSWVAYDLDKPFGELPECWHATVVRCPYGQPRDRLWVKETHRETFDVCQIPVMEYRAGGTRLIGIIDGQKCVVHGEHRATSIVPHWRPSIHMPRWASRITLEVTGVSVERMQEISDEDCLAEGCDAVMVKDGIIQPINTQYRLLWESINGKMNPWESNPWVWVVEFRRVGE